MSEFLEGGFYYRWLYCVKINLLVVPDWTLPPPPKKDQDFAVFICLEVVEDNYFFQVSHTYLHQSLEGKRMI